MWGYVKWWLWFLFVSNPRHYWKRLTDFTHRKKTCEACALARKLRRMSVRHDWIVEIINDVYGAKMASYVDGLGVDHYFQTPADGLLDRIQAFKED